MGLQSCVDLLSRSHGQQGQFQGQSKGQKVIILQLSPISNVRPYLDSVDNFQRRDTTFVLITPLVAEILGLKHRTPPPFWANFAKLGEP